jgi:hypothetical protein
VPYPQLEELTSRKREKVALFLTAENMAGLLAVGLPAYIGTLDTTFWLRILILLAAAVLGVLLTTDVNGMACYERALWWVRGRLRRQITGRVIQPAEFLVAPVMDGDRAVPLGGPVRRARGRMTNQALQPRLHGIAGMGVAQRGRDLHGVTARTSHGTPAGTAAAGIVEDGDQVQG